MFSLHTLGNGVRLVLAPQRDTQSACVYALFPVGSRYEIVRASGASHFVEHMMFKGTERRPTTLHISRDLDRIGAEYNAFTGKEYTGYYIKANAQHVPLALDMLSDMCFRSTYKAEEFDRERKVILEEIHLYEDNPSMHLDDIFEQLLYRGHPLGRMISGTQETMLGITHRALIDYRDRHYQPQRLVLVLSGNIGDHAIEQVEATFGKFPRGRGRIPTPPAFRKQPRGPMVHLHHKETTQAQLALGVPTYGGDDPRQYPLVLLANILGGTMSSRLFIAVRERRGLAYSVHASEDAYADTGSFVISAGLDPDRIQEALRVILREIARIRDRGVTAEELSRAKENIEGRIVLGLENSFTRADWYGKQVLLRDEVLTPEERVAKLATVERAAVHGVAREVLKRDRLHLAIIGDFKDPKPFAAILAR